jgi:hypothetical protein
VTSGVGEEMERSARQRAAAQARQAKAEEIEERVGPADEEGDGSRRD